EVAGGAPMPGIPELLARLSVEGSVRLGLATGNFRDAAFTKLRYFGLEGYLSEGGFADDAEDRGELVGIAIERVANGRRTGPADIWVIGDTPLDIAAAQANSARSLGVATGSSSEEELRAAGADVTMPDLSDTDAAIRALVGEPRPRARL
ncbi:MAG: HAD hydrolase-like protein, partial [Dehalococcoidia bacterium]|nr:HAD hydrolase-like protein [Dehalococcoidia bacterium]